MDISYFQNRRENYFKHLKKRQGVCPLKYKFLFNAILLGLERGDIFYECGVASGGSAGFFASILEDANRIGHRAELHLFDTWEGMPEVNPLYDKFHKKGNIKCDFEDCVSYIKECVKNSSFIHYHKGLIPQTFKGLEHHKIAFAHIDVDIYQSYKDCLEFIWPRMIEKGIIELDDYAHGDCAGAKIATDEFFKNNLDIIKKAPHESNLQYYVVKS